jgi:hypothetical protein
MKTLLKVSMALGVAAASLSTVPVQAQTVQVKALGSSALFLELGLGAHFNGSGGLNASCVWSGTAAATDKSAGTALADSGNSWVAWTTGTGGSCSSPSTDSKVYSYLQTDSVVGNRCLFNGSNCTIAYPTTDPAPAGLILATASEVALPTLIANKLNAFAVNAAGTDIRPEDAKFATNRALTACNTPMVSGSQYRGLGYTNGSTIKSTDKSFNVINFSLPTSFSVTNVGATPILVVVNSNDSSAGLGQSGITNFTNAILTRFLDGTDSFSDQLLNGSASGDKVTVYLREPLSGTYNVMEYNVPNTTGHKSSQDVGVNQPAAQVNCNGSVPKSNPMNIGTPSGGARIRAIGTGEELADVQANSSGNSLGYSFWSVANFAKLAPVTTAKYLQYNTGTTLVDPLLKSGVSYSTFKGRIPTTGSTELADVNLSTTANGSYPIYSLIRLVNVGAVNTNVQALATSADKFVSFGTTTSRPDFITPSSLSVVRSHFTPPGVTTNPLANGDSKLGAMNSPCNATEAGGDVGGVIFTLTSDSSFCSTNGVKTGQTGHRI